MPRKKTTNISLKTFKIRRFGLGLLFLTGLLTINYGSKLPSSIALKPLFLAANFKQNDSLNNLETAVNQQVNQYRQSLNLPPLKLNSAISEQARIHSANMARGKVAFGHNGFERRIENISNTIAYRQAAENVAYNQGYDEPVTQAVRGWIQSPEHQKNMTGNFNLTGIGIAKNSKGEYYFTQIFILQLSESRG